MMKKLEPVLLMKKRTTNFHTPFAAVQSLNGPQDDINAARPECKNQDVFCFPSSPRESPTKKTTKEESKRERQVSKKDLTKAKKIMKV